MFFLGGATNNRKVFSFRRRAQMGSFISYLRMGAGGDHLGSENSVSTHTLL